MSKWRPRKEGCLYVIPDIHGASDLLDQILKRILPLRKKDKIIFLGDYIDRHVDSHKVVERLRLLKEEYGDRVRCLMGNHELMMLQGLGYLPCMSPGNQLDMWLVNGGKETVYGYAERLGVTKDPWFSFSSIISSENNMRRVMPRDHIEFLKNLEPFYEEDNFIFVHGGCHPEKHPSEYDLHTLTWDRSLVKLVETLTKMNAPLTWTKTIICGHSTRHNPVVRDKFMMLDIGAPRKLLVVEAHTREAFLAQAKKKRLVKYAIEESLPPKATAKTGPLVYRIE